MARPRKKVAPRKHLPHHRDRKRSVGDVIQKVNGVVSSKVFALESTLRYLSPRERSTTLDWSRKHARNTDGRPYSHIAFPHLGAPGGPADAMDDIAVRRVWLQFASRLGKTYFGQCCAMKKADCNPGPMMLASSVEKTAVEVTERTYRIIEHSPKIAWQLRPKQRRRQACIDFDACQCVVAWSRSVSTLADKEIEFGHGNEIDKWEHTSTSKEADPLKLFLDRFKNRPHHKVLLESTPSIRRSSRVESGRLGSTNCQFYVPCPHCMQYQTLEMGSKDNPRLFWEKLPNGRSDKDLARKTACYICAHCENKIEDHHRADMMRHGVWVPEGCKVNSVEAYRVSSNLYRSTLPDAGTSPPEKYEWTGWASATWVVGTPLRDGPDAGYQLSSLYALSLSWGDIAAEFVGCQGKPQELRNFINQWLAETWEHVRRLEGWEELGKRLIDKDLNRGVVPVWAHLLTIGIDRQAEEGQPYFPWCVDAWGIDWRCATIEYGRATSFEELFDLMRTMWPRAENKPSMSLRFGIIDSGYKPDGIYAFCKKCHSVKIDMWPGKGSNHVLESDYRLSQLGPNTSMPDMTLVYIDTVRSQLWLEGQLSGDIGSYSIFNGTLYDHQDFLEQITNDAAVDTLDTTNNIRQVWQRVNTGIPNDFRDCRRQSFIARILATVGREVTTVVAKEEDATEAKAKKNALVSAGTGREDGRPWL